ncbi:uncharacterized protein L969DRAFT_463164, partial [Mixia osmundae IAM 14324]|uniref:Uncharacterized protein n=1 Tax=Mixia osmundae (strain CBS 9802 / IAM 14324 / JCM 22182 / KY 12970) TaxID=764103 RepID=G7E451_MIXOS
MLLAGFALVAAVGFSVATPTLNTGDVMDLDKRAQVPIVYELGMTAPKGSDSPFAHFSLHFDSVHAYFDEPISCQDGELVACHAQAEGHGIIDGIHYSDFWFTRPYHWSMHLRMYHSKTGGEFFSWHLKFGSVDGEDPIDKYLMTTDVHAHEIPYAK